MNEFTADSIRAALKEEGFSDARCEAVVEKVWARFLDANACSICNEQYVYPGTDMHDMTKHRAYNEYCRTRPPGDERVWDKRLGRPVSRG